MTHQKRDLEEIKAEILGMSTEVKKLYEEQGRRLIRELESHLPADVESVGPGRIPSLAEEMQGDLGELVADLEDLENRLASIAAYDASRPSQRFEHRQRERLERSLKKLSELEPILSHATREVGQVYQSLEPWLPTGTDPTGIANDLGPFDQDLGRLALLVSGINSRLVEATTGLVKVQVLSLIRPRAKRNPPEEDAVD